MKKLRRNHGAAFKAKVAIEAMPLAHLFRLGQDYGSLNIIDNEKKEMRLIAMNLTH
jgi:hypothetical protein